MKNFIRKLFIVLVILLVGFVFLGCGKDPEKEPSTPVEKVENYTIQIEEGEEKTISLDTSLKYEVNIEDKTIVGFSNNTFFGLKEGKTKVIISISGTEPLKQIYEVEVVKAKEIIAEYQKLMTVGASQEIVIKCDDKEISDYEVFIENVEVLSYVDNKIVAKKAGTSNVTVTASVNGKTLSTSFTISAKEESSEFDFPLVIGINEAVYNNQTVSYTVKTEDGNDVSDYEVIIEGEEIVEFYPEDNEFATLDEGTVLVTFKAVIDDKTYGKTITIEVLPAVYLDVRISDNITNEKDITFDVYVMPDNVKLEGYTSNSSDKKVFTVSSNVLTPIIPGKAYLMISGTYNGANVSISKSIVVTQFIPAYIDSNIDDFMIINNELLVDAIIKPSNEEVSDLIITSSNNSIIEVVNNKLVAKSEGNATVTLKANGLEKAYDITVIDVTSLEIVVSDKVLLHEVLSFDVVAKPSNTKINLSSLNLTYSSSNTNVLVNDHALFGSALGTSNITVTLSYKKNLSDTSDTLLTVTKELTVYEEEKKAEGLSLDYPNALIVGATVEGSYAIYPLDVTDTVKLSSSDETVIKVEDGKLVALKEGKSVIRGTLDSNEEIYDEVEIVVKAKKEVVEVSDGLFNGGPMTARYQEDSIVNYFELMCGVTETTYHGYTSTRLSGDVDGYSGITGEIVADEYYGQAVHVLEVPSRQDVVVVPWANLNNNKWSLTTVKGLIINYEENNPGYKVIAAVNGDFFDINANKNLPYSTTGENISNGEFYKVTNGFSHIGGTIGFTNDGSSLTLVAGANTTQKYSDYFVLDIYDENDNIIKSFNIPTYNDEAAAGSSSVYYGTYNEEKKYVPITPVGNNTFVIEGAMLALPSDYNDFYGKGVITSTGNKELQIGDFAITTSDSELINYLKVGTLVRCQRVFVGEFAGVTSATGYNGVIFDEEGIFDFYANGNLSNRAPRTVIGMKADGTLVMMVVDGRQGDKDMYGCDGYELTAIMRAYGCIKAYNVDGGGSSTIVVRANGGLQVLNSPSDGHERTDGNCILICTVDPDYKASVDNIKSDSAEITVSTDNAAFSSYNTYVEIGNKMLKTENGKVSLTGLIHNYEYSYRIYYEKDDEIIPTQTVGSFTTSKAGFKFLGLYIEETSDKYLIYSYSIDDDHSGNVNEMTVIINGKNAYLKNGYAEVKKADYGDIIEKLGYEYWYNDDKGRNMVTVSDGLYFMK